ANIFGNPLANPSSSTILDAEVVHPAVRAVAVEKLQPIVLTEARDEDLSHQSMYVEVVRPCANMQLHSTPTVVRTDLQDLLGLDVAHPTPIADLIVERVWNIAPDLNVIIHFLNLSTKYT